MQYTIYNIQYAIFSIITEHCSKKELYLVEESLRKHFLEFIRLHHCKHHISPEVCHIGGEGRGGVHTQRYGDVAHLQTRYRHRDLDGAEYDDVLCCKKKHVVTTVVLPNVVTNVDGVR